MYVISANRRKREILSSDLGLFITIYHTFQQNTLFFLCRQLSIIAKRENSCRKKDTTLISHNRTNNQNKDIYSYAKFFTWFSFLVYATRGRPTATCIALRCSQGILWVASSHSMIPKLYISDLNISKSIGQKKSYKKKSKSLYTIGILYTRKLNHPKS